MQSLRPQDKQFILSLKLSSSLQNQLVAIANDLRLWQKPLLESFWPTKEELKGHHDKDAIRFALKIVNQKIDKMRNEETDYSDFIAPSLKMEKEIANFDANDSLKLFGRCPCPPEAEILRCCNLKTLDAIQQCSFGCSYCSIQSFYCKNEVKFISNLKEKLLSLDLEPNIWHLGTGQSSDSLLYGDSYGTLSALNAFAKKNPNVVIELKTKSSRTDFLNTLKLENNIIATWSLNAPTIIKNEELLTADLDNRLIAARKVADSKTLVGFHFHPMVYFKNWQKEYKEVVDKLVSMFKPEELITISMGTLTFPKPVINRLRNSQRESRILQMPLVPIAGKYSYPLSIKKEMFSTLYSFFPQEYKDKCFFYICMEDPSLWLDCFGYEYHSNAEFEQSMKSSYLSKINTLST